ncbi:MAG: amidohydrolase [Candidatus Cloacimonas sp. 4484_209]|nr:MAG: amidohydrolase [Candidatus Cloacimonas sp. 4484_209]
MILLKNGKVYTMAGKILDPGDILIDGTKIKRVGKNIPVSKNYKVFDLRKKIVTPGLIDAHCHVGIFGEGTGWAGEDGNEMTDPWTPHLRAIDAVYPEDEGFNDAVKGGITAVFTGPGSGNVIGGQSIVVKTGGSNIIDERVVKNPAGLKMALGENPKRVYSTKKQMPSTRMGNAAVIRDAFFKAKNYMRKKKQAKGNPQKMPDFDIKMEALSLVLQRKIRARAHAHRADDIVTMVRIRDEFGFNLVIEHGTEAHKIAAFLSKKNVPVVVGPSMSARVKVELKEITFKTPKVLYENGVLIAIMTDAPVVPINYLRLMVGLSIKEGLPYLEGMKAVTANAARICDVDRRLGTIEKGKDADIAVFDGDPFDMKSSVVMTVVDGNIVWKG